MSGPPPHILENTTMSTTTTAVEPVRILRGSYLVLAKNNLDRHTNIHGTLAMVEGLGRVARWSVRGRHGDVLHGYARPYRDSDDGGEPAQVTDARGPRRDDPVVLHWPHDALAALDEELE